MPGDHPSLLAKQIDVDRLEAQIAELRSARGLDASLIRQLQGGRGAGYWSYHGAGTLTGAASGYQVAPIPNTPDPGSDTAAFVRNADGTITVRDAGDYTITTTISVGVTNATARRFVTIAIGDGTVQTNQLAMSEAGVAPGGIYIGAPSYTGYLPAGAKIGCYGYCDSIAMSWRVYHFGISRCGQGPPGPRGPQGGVLDIQTIWGTANVYLPLVGSQELFCDAAKTVPLRLTYTPPVDCWWEVQIHLGTMQKIDAAYHYSQLQCAIVPNDVDGQSTSTATIMQHSQVQTFEAFHIARAYRLAAGVTYRTNFTAGISGGSWQYHAGVNTLYASAKAWAR